MPTGQDLLSELLEMRKKSKKATGWGAYMGQFGGPTAQSIMRSYGIEPVPGAVVIWREGEPLEIQLPHKKRGRR